MNAIATRQLYRLALILALAGTLLPLYGCGVGDADAAAAPAPVAVVPVVAVSPERGDAHAVHMGTVNLEAEREAWVAARIGGEVREILVEEGEVVKPGQVIARLDDARLQLEATRALADLNKLKQEYRRTVQLHERGLVSQGAFETLRYDLEALDAVWQLAQLKLDHATVKATIGGVVAERLVKVGNTVAEGDALFRISNTRGLVAHLFVPQRELYRFEPGQVAQLDVDALPGRAFEARVLRISPRVDAESGTVKITLAVEDTGGSLRPGMFGRVRLAYETRADTLLVPSAAILDEDQEQAVYVIEDGVARRRPVATGLSNGARTEILSGLEDSSSVIVVGQAAVRDGTPVAPRAKGQET